MYEDLFKCVFPEWSDVVPLNMDTYIVNDQESGLVLPIIKESTFLWKITCDGMTNIYESSNTIDSDSTEIICISEFKEIIYYSFNELPQFEEGTVHIVPNLNWICQVFPMFLYGHTIYDPFIASWMENTEIYKKPSILHSLDEISINFDSLYDLMGKLNDRLVRFKTNPIWNWYSDIEIKHLRILGKMHNHTLKPDIKKMEEYQKYIEKQIQATKSEIYVQAGKEFNIMSPKECSLVISTCCNLSLENLKKNNSIDSRHRHHIHTNPMDTSEAALNSVDHPIAGLIIQYRSHQKIKSLLDGILSHTDDSGELHPTFKICSTATGRISISSPNLMNVPKKLEGHPIGVRDLLKPLEGSTIISVDYSQIEIRVIAHFSKDRNFIELCNRNDTDIHSCVASLIFGLTPNQAVSTKQREHAKKIVYSTLYGTNVPEDSRKVNEYFPSLNRMKNEIIKEARIHGFVKTICGKKRYLPNINSQIATERSRDNRIAVNTVIQGSTADFVKYALIKIMNNCGDKIIPLLQIHDEWIFETKIPSSSTNFEFLVEKIKLSAECSEEFGFSLNIPVQIKYGESYGEIL